MREGRVRGGRSPDWHSVQSPLAPFAQHGADARTATERRRGPALTGEEGNGPVPVPDLGTGGDRGNPRHEPHRRPLPQRDGLCIAVPATVPGATAVDDSPITERPMGHSVRQLTRRLPHGRRRDGRAAPVAGHGFVGTTDEPRAAGDTTVRCPGGRRRQGLLPGQGRRG